VILAPRAVLDVEGRQPQSVWSLHLLRGICSAERNVSAAGNRRIGDVNLGEAASPQVNDDQTLRSWRHPKRGAGGAK
jgi:hypothetical protein